MKGNMPSTLETQAINSPRDRGNSIFIANLDGRFLPDIDKPPDVLPFPILEEEHTLAII